MNNKIKTSLNDGWINIIWDWADTYQLNEEQIPRNKADLLSLTRLVIDTSYEYAGYYANYDRMPEDYYTTPLYHMKEVPKELAYLENLEHIYFSNVDISKFVEKISQLTKLKSFNTFASKIRELPNDINKLQKLESLNLWESELKALPEAICQISTLKTLSVRSSSLNRLPNNLDKLQDLESLEFESNQMVCIPRSVFKLIRLKDLTIHGDQIKEIPCIINGLESLEYLAVFTENLISWHDNTAELPNLKFIKTYMSLSPILPNNIDQSKVEIMLV